MTSLLKNCFLSGVPFTNIIRLWLTCILLFIPFQHKIFLIIKSWNIELANRFNLLDELTVVILLPLAIIDLYKSYKKREISIRAYLIILFPILAVCLSGFISGVLNENSLLITSHGIFSYIKFFLVIFIYAAFFREFNKFQRIFCIMLIVAICIGIVAIIYELYAMYYRYILEYDPRNANSIIDKILIFVIGKGLRMGENIQPWGWRFGIYRTASFMVQHNLLGFYSLFILTIYLYVVKKVNFASFFLIFAGIFVSVSRVAYLCFALLAGLQILKGRRWLIILLIPILLFLLYIFFLSNFNILSDDMNIPEEVKPGETISGQIISYREYARSKALEVWKDYPVWGAGPGMFGSDVAVKYVSPLYEKYNALELLEFRTLDQFWPQSLAEMGVIGTAAFAGLLISLLVTFLISRQQATTAEIKGLFTGLALFTIFIVFLTFGSSLNIVSILFPYCAFAGMGLGCEGQYRGLDR